MAAITTMKLGLTPVAEGRTIIEFSATKRTIAKTRSGVRDGK